MEKSILELYLRECDTAFIAKSLSIPLDEVEDVIAKHLVERIRDMWVDSDKSQAVIAATLNVLPSYVYKVVATSFTVEQRIARKSRMQRLVQTDERVAPPSWYTGPGRSVPLKVVEYCEAMGLTCLPPGMSVVLMAQGMFALMTKAEAKMVAQTRSIIVGGIDATQD